METHQYLYDDTVKDQFFINCVLSDDTILWATDTCRACHIFLVVRCATSKGFELKIDKWRTTFFPSYYSSWRKEYFAGTATWCWYSLFMLTHKVCCTKLKLISFLHAYSHTETYQHIMIPEYAVKDQKRNWIVII